MDRVFLTRPPICCFQLERTFNCWFLKALVTASKLTRWLLQVGGAVSAAALICRSSTVINSLYGPHASKRRCRVVFNAATPPVNDRRENLTYARLASANYTTCKLGPRRITLFYGLETAAAAATTDMVYDICGSNVGGQYTFDCCRLQNLFSIIIISIRTKYTNTQTRKPPKENNNVCTLQQYSVQRCILRYNSVYLTCIKKLTGSQLSLPHGTNKKIKM